MGSKRNGVWGADIGTWLPQDVLLLLAHELATRHEAWARGGCGGRAPSRADLLAEIVRRQLAAPARPQATPATESVPPSRP